MDKNQIKAKILAHEEHLKASGNGMIHTNGLENFWSLLKRGKRFGVIRCIVFPCVPAPSKIFSTASIAAPHSHTPVSATTFARFSP